MSQSKRSSAFEASANIIVGIFVSWALTFGVMPLWGFNPTVADATEITALFTAASFARSYGLRRLFNWLGSIDQEIKDLGKEL